MPNFENPIEQIQEKKDPCLACGGTGKVDGETCTECKGKGYKIRY